MEKTWEEFYQSGKVTDYLKYRNSIESDSKKAKEQTSDGRDGCTDRHGFDSHAN